MVRAQVRCLPLNDCFVRFSSELCSILISRLGQSVYGLPFHVVTAENKTVIVWPIEDNHSFANGLILTIDRKFAILNNIRPGDLIDITLISGSSHSISKLVVEPLEYKDQYLASEYAELLSGGAILEQIRAVSKDMIFPVYIEEGKKCIFKVNEVIGGHVYFGVIDYGTDLEIMQPHKKMSPSTKMTAPIKENEAWLALIPNASIDAGKAVISLQDVLLHRWLARGNNVQLVISYTDHFRICGAANGSSKQLGVIASLRAKMQVKPGHLAVNPNLLSYLGIPKGGYAKIFNYSSSPSSCKTVEIACSKDLDKIEASKHVEKAIAKFESNDELIVPSLIVDEDNLLTFNNNLEPFVEISLQNIEKIQFVPAEFRKKHDHDWNLSSLPAELLLFLRNKPRMMFIANTTSNASEALMEKHFIESSETLMVNFEKLFKGKGLKDKIRTLRDFKDELELISDEIVIVISGCNSILESAPQVLVEEEQWAHESLRGQFVDLICRMKRTLIMITMAHTLPSKLFNRTISKATLKDLSATENVLAKEFEKISLGSNFAKWDSIRGLDDAKQVLLETIIWPIKYQKIYSANGFERPGGVLLHGASGCGKTMLLTSLSTVGGFKTIIVRGPELIGKYIGTSEAAIRDIFEEARKNKPAVICFDEIDALAPRRGNDSTGVTDRVVNQLLTEIDGTNDRSGVFVVATSSRPELIDPALLRSGRIERMVEIRLPGLVERADIVKSLLDDCDLDVGRIAEATESFTIAEIKGLVYDAHMSHIQNNTDLTTDVIIKLAKIRTVPDFDKKQRIGQKASFA